MQKSYICIYILYKSENLPYIDFINFPAKWPFFTCLVIFVLYVLYYIYYIYFTYYIIQKQQKTQKQQKQKTMNIQQFCKKWKN